MQRKDDADFDRILIKDLLVRCIIGVNESERREKQDVLISVCLWTDLKEASETDDIGKTVDYKKITKNIIAFVEKSDFFLVETLAENVAKICLIPERVKRAKVVVEKPGALRFAKSVGVEIVRERNQIRK